MQTSEQTTYSITPNRVSELFNSNKEFANELIKTLRELSCAVYEQGYEPKFRREMTQALKVLKKAKE